MVPQAFGRGALARAAYEYYKRVVLKQIKGRRIGKALFQLINNVGGVNKQMPADFKGWRLADLSAAANREQRGAKDRSSRIGEALVFQDGAHFE